jgi:hypothetical protein
MRLSKGYHHSESFSRFIHRDSAYDVTLEERPADPYWSSTEQNKLYFYTLIRQALSKLSHVCYLSLILRTAGIRLRLKFKRELFTSYLQPSHTSFFSFNLFISFSNKAVYSVTPLFFIFEHKAATCT